MDGIPDPFAVQRAFIVLVGIFVFGSLFVETFGKYLDYKSYETHGCYKQAGLFVCDMGNSTVCYINRDMKIFDCVVNPGFSAEEPKNSSSTH